MKKEEQKFICINQATKRMGCGYSLVKQGKAPPHYVFGKTTRIPVKSFEKWLQGQIVHPNIEV